MEDLQRLIASRRGHKAHLTKILKKITELKETDEDQNKQDAIVILGSYLEQLERKAKVLSELDDKISLLITKPDELEADILETEETQSFIAEIICTTKSFIENKTNTIPSQANTTNVNHAPVVSHNAEETPENNQTTSETNNQTASEASTSQETQVESNTVSEVLPVNLNQTVNTSTSIPSVNPTVSNSSYSMSRLPKLALPTFDGNPLGWQSFWDSFCTAVHDNPYLSNVQKLNYLRAQLSGEASRSIAGFPLTENNYTESIKLLQERFGQQHRAVSAHMQALLNIPSPTSTLSSLKNFYDTLETHIRALEALGKSHDSYGDILVPIIHKKLPVDLIKTFTREHNTNEWKLDELRKAIRREIDILQVGENNPPMKEQNQIFPDPPTAAFAIGQTPNMPYKSHHSPSTPAKRVCVYCKGSHSPINCTVVVDKKHRHNIVRDSKLCFNCLNDNHLVSQCKTKGRCKICRRKHHTSLCSADTPPPPEKDKQDPNPTPPKESVHTINTSPTEVIPTPSTISPTTIQHLGENIHKTTLLKTAISPIEHNGSIVNAHILFDEGSHRSFITSSLAKDVGLAPEREETLCLSTFGGSTTAVRRVEVGTINLQTPNRENIAIEVIIVPKIAAPLQNVATIELHKLPHLKGLKFAHPITKEHNFEANLLIGADYYWSVVEDEIIKGSGPTAAKSKIGYLLSGPMPFANQTTAVNTAILNIMTASKEEEFEFRHFWELESIGIQPNQTDETSDFLRHYQDTSISLKDGKYHAKLPWKPDQPVLPSNAAIAEKRTRSMIHRLSNDPEKLKMYNDVIVSQEKQDFIEKVENPNKNTRTCHYIPHHAVIKESSTTPLRVVYDCSCRKSSEHPSLNDCLTTGPPILNDLTAILLRFRRPKYGLTADIEKAFLNIVLDEEDRDATRFFWLSNPNDPYSTFDVYRFKRVLFGATSSPFILNATLDKHLKQFSDPVAERIREDIYVDDLVSGAGDDTEAVSFYTSARTLMTPGGFNMRSWASNNTAVKSIAAKDNLLNDNPKPKVLGMKWDIANDTLLYPNNVTTSQSTSATKREVLRASSKVYDPIGFLNPVIVNAKILMQEIWKAGLQWDELLPPEMQEKWTNLVRELQTSTHLQLPRRYFPMTNEWPKDTELHVFVDASLKAYGASAYVKLLGSLYN